jgi:hypothetical protein
MNRGGSACISSASGIRSLRSAGSWDPAKVPGTAGNTSSVIHHAVSIDEGRWFFRQKLLQPEGIRTSRSCGFRAFIPTWEAAVPNPMTDYGECRLKGFWYDA